MKNKKVVALALVVVMLAGTVMSVMAEEQAEPNLNASVTDNVVEFEEPNWEEIPVVIPGPEEYEELPSIGSGPFTLTSVPRFDFDTHVITLGMDTEFEVLPATQVGADAGAYGDHFVTVRDMRNWAAGDDSNGWTVTATMVTPFTLVGGTDILNGATITFEDGANATGYDMSGNVMDANQLPGTTLANGAVLGYDLPALTIATAAAGEGEGRTALNFGQGEDIVLDVIDVANLRIGEFWATIDWVLSAPVTGE